MISFNPCFVLPNHNHGSASEIVVGELISFGLSIIIVNDASDLENSRILRKTANSHPLVHLIELEINQGKGGAVMAGIFEANRQGKSHVFQIDADGQHDLSDVSLFLSESEKSPASVVCGNPIFDKSVPLSRLLPRYITHFWVWIETLSFSIVDSMCGFRIYPLNSVIPLIKRGNIGQRMDFDIEILVRLYWESANLKFIPTKVIYPKNGQSNFHVWKDNWLITKMHTKLVFGMIYRMPKIWMVKKHNPRSSLDIINTSAHWSIEKEKGTSLGLWFLVWIYKIFGGLLIKLLLHPIVAYFTIFAFNAKSASIQYQSRLATFQKRNSKIGLRHVYAHFYEFANSAIDKIGSWTGQIRLDSVTIHNPEIVDNILDSGQGAVFIGSHLGNLELSRAIGQRRTGLVINAVVFNKHALKFQNVLNRSNPDVRLNLIHVETIGSDTAILLQQKVEQGEAVIIVGDRTSVNAVGRVEYVYFLGEKAPFPQGPFILAGLLECPVYLINCIREPDGYHVYHEYFAESLRFPRNKRKVLLKQAIQRYADRLAYFCQKAPLQWFNFFDFWRPDNQDIIRREKN